MATTDFLSTVVEVAAPLCVELSFLVFFTLGFIFLRLDLFTKSKKGKKTLDCEPPQFSPSLKKAIEAESSSGSPAAVLKAWRAGKNIAPTPSDLLKNVVQAFIDLEPQAIVTEFIEHVQRHAMALKNSRTAVAVLNVVARAGHVEVMADFWSAFQRTLETAPTYQMYECILGGYAAVGDDAKVKATIEEMRQRRMKPTARGCSIIIKGFLKNNMVDACLEQLLSMKSQSFIVPPFAVTQFVRIAGDAGRITEAFNAIEGSLALPAEAAAHLLEDACRHSNVDFARRVEKAAREALSPLPSTSFDPLLKLYTAQGDLYAIELFREMQTLGVRASDGLCVGLLARCAEAKFVRFAEEIVKFSRARGGMTIAVYSSLMKVYAYCGMYDKACDLYDQIREDGLEPDAMMYGCLMKFSVECGRTKLSQELSEKSPCLDIQNYMSLIRAAGRDRDVDRAFSVLQRLRDSGVALDVAAYNCVLDVCVSAGDMKRARALVNDMGGICSVDIITYNTLMKGYCACGNLKGAKDLLAEMKRAGHPPNDVSYNCLINATVSSGHGNFHEAWETIELMERNGVAVDQYTISIMMKALKKVQNPRDVAKALALLDRTGLDICSDEILLNTVLETCIRHRELRRLENVLAAYSRSNLRPSVHTYGSLIKACSALKRIDQCWELWREMEERRGMEPQDVVLGCMLDALVCNEHIDDAVELFNGWKGRVQPNKVLYSTLIKGFANAHKPEMAMAAWREMRELRVEMNTQSYNVIIDAQARVGAMDEVWELVQAMKQDNCVPDAITWSTIVKGYCVKGDLDKAFQALRTTQKNDMAHDSVIYNTVLDGCTRHGRFDLADELLEDMEQYKITPSNFTLGILVKMYGRRRMLHKAFEVVDQLPKRWGFTANAQVSTCLISACLNNNAVDSALEVFEGLKNSGPGADAKAYAALISGCVRQGELDKAAAVIEEAYGLLGARSGAGGGGQRPAHTMLETEPVEMLLRAYAHRGQMETKGTMLLEQLRSAKVPISGRFLDAILSGKSGAFIGAKGKGKGKGRSFEHRGSNRSSICSEG